MLPLVKLAGSLRELSRRSVHRLARGIAPAVLLLVLEAPPHRTIVPDRKLENVVLAVLFAFGSVYFFTAVETVWFAAVVVGTAAFAGSLRALRARRRAPASRRDDARLRLHEPADHDPVGAAPGARGFSRLMRRVSPRRGVAGGAGPDGMARARPRARREELLRICTTDPRGVRDRSLLNHARYLNWSPFDPGHEYLTVGWHGRMVRWGLFGYHYLGKNLGVALTGLPWLPPKDGVAQFGAPFKINERAQLYGSTPITSGSSGPSASTASPSASGSMSSRRYRRREP